MAAHCRHSALTGPPDQSPAAIADSLHSPSHGSLNPMNNREITLMDVIRLILNHKWWLIVLTFLGASGGFFYGKFQQPEYRADVLISVVESQESGGGLAELASQYSGLAGAVGLPSSGSDKDVSLAVLRSRAFAVKFARDRKLAPTLFYKRYMPESQSWSDELGGEPSDNEIVEIFNERILSVREDGKTGLVTVSVYWENPDLAAQWANEIVRELNMQLRERARLRARNSLDFLNQEVQRESKAETQRVIYNLIEGQINKIMLANVTEEYAFNVIDKAVPPDMDDPVKPRRLFLIIAGAVTGFTLAGLIIVIRRLRAAYKAHSPAIE